jgi:predicted AlkP superfamily phosphohydrolase/phosphomutase
VIINKECFSDEQEHRRILDYLIAELAKVINLDTGTPIVQDIFATQDEYHGAHLERMPDIMIVWDNDTPVSRVGSAAIGELVQAKLPDWSGTHRPYSLAILWSFKEKIELKSTSGSILDVAPTLADYAGASMATTQGRSVLA